MEYVKLQDPTKDIDEIIKEVKEGSKSDSEDEGEVANASKSKYYKNSERRQEGQECYKERSYERNQDRYYEDDFHERHYYDEGLRFYPTLELPKIEGRMDANALLDWLASAERVFDLYKPPKSKRVKLVAVKLKKSAFF
ncbi:hypothetical protein PTKIN_Ptkin11bG0105700 [Pterospermum kingtungense]